jgi:hypothetical protein
MVTVRTALSGTMIESARRDRVEKVGAITATNVQKALENLDSSLTIARTGALTQRSITSVADLPVQSADSILNCNLSAPLTIPVPLASTRSGAPLRIVDVGRNFATNNVTLTRAGTDTFDGQTSLTLDQNDMDITLTPYNDGVNAGYKIT